MLIKALSDYYDVLAQRGDTIKDGFSSVGISYLVALKENGDIADIYDYRKKIVETAKNGKEKISFRPNLTILPQRTQKPGIDSNIIEHRSLYIFGLNFENGEFNQDDKTDKAKKSHAIFIESNLEFISGLESPLINAYRNFLQNWNPEEQAQNEHLLKLGKSYGGATYYGFCLEHRPDLLLHEEEPIIKKWEESIGDGVNKTEESVCSVSGEAGEVARLHNKIKGVYGGQASGCVLVGFNNSSEESYNKEQSYNSNITESTMKKYTEALNYLTANRNHRALLDETTIVYFAISKKDQEYSDWFCNELFGVSDETTQNMLDKAMQDAKDAILVREVMDFNMVIENNIDFYIVGLKPNAARISIKFICKNSFDKLFYNIAQHSVDLRISKDGRTPKLWQIKKELLSPKSKNEKVDPALMANFLQAIFNGTSYPASLLATIIRRIKTDSDEENNTFIKLNNTRLGIIKAVINRKLRLQGKEEEIKMALDKENTNLAYLCGRLFAVLEKAQKDASKTDLNKTIKDSYFSAACTTPASIFPKLIKLAQHHTAKGDYGYYYQAQIGEIIKMLDGAFPKILPLEEQGKFIIGYYQEFYTRKEKAQVKDEETDQGKTKEEENNGSN